MALVSYRTTNDLREIATAFELVCDLTDSYPDFEAWWHAKAVPDIIAGRGTMLLAEQDSQIVGLSLSKKTPDETKIRCLRVMPGWRNKGIGLNLADRTLKLLDCAKPLITVPHDMIHDYARPLVNMFHFDLTYVAKGYYRPGRLEYCFNGRI